MKRKITIKSIVLLALIVLSILQIEKLWFGENSNHDFFPYKKQESSLNIALQDLMFEPEYIAIYKAVDRGEYYLLDSDGILFNTVLKDSGKLLKRLPEMSEFSYRHKNLFSRPHIMCRFSVPIKQEVIEKIVGKKNDNKTGDFNSMVIVPADIEENHFQVIFMADDTNLGWGFSIDKLKVQEENEVFSQYIGKSVLGDNLLFSAKEQDLTAFSGEVLLPSKKQNYILPQDWNWELSFIKHQGSKKVIDIEKIQEYLASYVKNPKVLWNIIQEERVRYGDSSIIMEYNTKGIFNYRYIQELDENATSLPAGVALKKVFQFLNKDDLLNNQEFKLVKYVQDEDEQYFYFNYYFRGYPFVWDKKFQTKYDMEYPMQVVMKKNEIIDYRRVLLQSDDLLQQGSRFQVNYEEALNQFYQNQNKDKIENLYLGYFIKEKKIKLGWVVETKTETFLYPLTSEGK